MERYIKLNSTGPDIIYDRQSKVYSFNFGGHDYSFMKVRDDIIAFERDGIKKIYKG